MQSAPEAPESRAVDEPQPLADLLPVDLANPISRFRRLGLLLASGFFFALGLIGWLIPVITGIPFYVLSLILLGMAVPPVARRLNRWERRLKYERRLQLRRLLARLWHPRGARSDVPQAGRASELDSDQGTTSSRELP